MVFPARTRPLSVGGRVLTVLDARFSFSGTIPFSAYEGQIRPGRLLDRHGGPLPIAMESLDHAGCHLKAIYEFTA
jgi:hypothetical protein